MELIVSHMNTDFDGLASMLGASKLYPSAVMVCEGKPTKQVREFLALHKDALPLQDSKNLDLEKVTKVVVVDTNSSSRLGSVAKVIRQNKAEVHVYDHHPKAAGDIHGVEEFIDTIGAATTLLVEKIQARHISLTAFEATILALGIYEDTGSLLFESTTPRDVRAIAYLLECGANLQLVSEFMVRPLSREQKSLLNTLLTSARHYLVKSTKVLIASASIDEFVAGLALLSHKISEIENLDVIFLVVRMDDRVHIVARSKGKHLAVNDILQEFGGGGHPKAASATVKNGDVEVITNRILKLLEDKVIPETVAGEIMSFPVNSIPSTTTIQEAQNILLRYGHTGIPVVEGAKLCGIISRRDIDKAINHRLGHAQVTGYMSRGVIGISPDTPLSEIQDLMISHDIGRLPVVDGGVLVGIISRSDVLRTLHGQAVPVSPQILSQRSIAQGEEVLRQMEELPLHIRDVFRLVQEISKEHGFKVYVVGGFVRDLLLGVPNLDIDLVVEGDGITFAKLLANSMLAKVQVHPQFGTATLTCQEGLQIDVVTARTEYYDSPAALPQVEISGLKQDLYRRDFTVNAMAIRLDSADFGRLEDYYGGYRDLQQGVIRILHNLSMVDDPTRILRAVRFEQRLNFKIEKQTQWLIEQAVADRLLDKLSRERIKNELVFILQESKTTRIFERLWQLGVWEQVLPGVTKINLAEKFASIQTATEFLEELGLWNIGFLWQVKLQVMLQDLPLDRAQEFLQSLKFERSVCALVKQFLLIKDALTGIYSLEGEMKKGIIHRMLEKAPKALIAALITIPELQSGIKEYLIAWAGSKVMVTGKDLLAMGIQTGPIYAKVLNALWEARLEGRINSREQELELVRSLVEEGQ